MIRVLLKPARPQPTVEPPASSYTTYNTRPSLSTIQVQPCWRYQSANTGCTPVSLNPRPLPMLLALQEAGIHPAEGSWILYQLAKEQDIPYHAALLLNGKAFVISQQDRAFYGPPGNLKPMKVIEAWRTKCPDEQTRVVKMDNGLEIRIKTQNGLKTSKAYQERKGPLILPLFPKAEAQLPQFSGLSIQA